LAEAIIEMDNDGRLLGIDRQTGLAACELNNLRLGARALRDRE
jgi:hypothetical protein